MPCIEFCIQAAQILRAGLHTLVGNACGLAQAGEIQHRHRGGHCAAPMSRLPPRLDTNLVGPMLMLCDNALHMS